MLSEVTLSMYRRELSDFYNVATGLASYAHTMYFQKDTCVVVHKYKTFCVCVRLSPHGKMYKLKVILELCNNEAESQVVCFDDVTTPDHVNAFFFFFSYVDCDAHLLFIEHMHLLKY